jgi:glycosyltransferase involved in cell wall biosynthesis
MKILQFMASQEWGGAESVFVDLANELAKSHPVTALLLRGTEYIGRFSSDVRLVTLRSNPTRYNPFLLMEIFTRLRAIKPDIIHTHAVKGTELVNSANRFLRIPHVGTKHNVRKGRIFNKLPWVTAVSETSRKTIHALPSSKVKVIYNGLTPSYPPETRKDRVFTILAIGRLDKIKGFDILIGQLNTLPFDFKLLIAGEGPEKANLEQTIKSAGLEKKVFLLGFREDIPLLMKSSHGVVIPSHSEGFSKVLAESMFYADAVLSTPVGIAVDVLPAMFLAEQNQLSEKITQLYQNYEQFTLEFRHISENRRNEFLLSGIAEKYYHFYLEILGGWRSDQSLDAERATWNRSKENAREKGIEMPLMGIEEKGIHDTTRGHCQNHTLD